MSSSVSDHDLARQLQEKFDLEFAAAQSEANSEVVDFLPAEARTPSKIKPPEPTSLVAPEWEDLDPTPGWQFISKTDDELTSPIQTYLLDTFVASDYMFH